MSKEFGFYTLVNEESSKSFFFLLWKEVISIFFNIKSATVDQRQEEWLEGHYNGPGK